MIDAACREFTLEDLRNIVQGKEWYPIFWEKYIQKMFDQRGDNPRFRKKALHWLQWLAKRMQPSSQVSFRIEELHPDWLKAGRQRWYYRFLWLINSLIGGTLYSLSFGLIFFGMIGVVHFRENFTAHRIAIKNVILAHPLLSQIYDWSPALFAGIYSGLAVGLFFAIPFMFEAFDRFFNGTYPNDRMWEVMPTGKFKLSITRENLKLFQDSVRCLLGLILLLLISFPILMDVLSIWDTELRDKIFGSDLTVGNYLSFAISLLPLIGIVFVILPLYDFINIPKLEKSDYPNQGTWNAARNFITLGLLSFLANGLIYGASIGFIRGLEEAVVGGIIFGIAATIFTASFRWFDGAKVCIRHLTLRLILWQSGEIPWDYRKFLDDATSRMLLKQEGGAYEFYQDSLQQYFADMDDDHLMEQQ